MLILLSWAKSYQEISASVCLGITVMVYVTKGVPLRVVSMQGHVHIREDVMIDGKGDEVR